MNFTKRISWYIHEFLSACWEVIKLPFWLIGEGFRRLWGFGSRRLLMLFGAAVVVTIFALTSFVKATSQPGFCKSCHVMQPYFEAWKLSKHNNVSCTMCHVPPGLEGTIHHKFQAISMVANYATGLYKRSKPWAEIDDRSCLRSGCHDTRLLKSTENFKGVLFDHRPHLEKPRRDRQLRCTSCHAQIVQGAHIAVTEGTCFLCHFKPDHEGKPTELSRCTHCHTPPTGAAADTSFDHSSVLARSVDCLNCHATAVSGDGFVPQERCNTCHAKVEHIQRYGDLDFVHLKHVTEHKVECLNCHVAIRHGRNVAEKDRGQECFACHGGSDNAIEKVWKGELPGLPPSPSTMAKAGMSCTSCHAEPIHMREGGFGTPTCSPCHASNYEDLWKQWKVYLPQAIARLEADIKRLPRAQADSLESALALYRRGNPLHNPGLVPVFAARIRGPKTATAGNCATCHPAALDAAPLWHGRPVVHRKHAAAGLECEQCHEPQSPRHGALKLTAAQCNACHHRETEGQQLDCATCHSVQVQTFKGELAVAGMQGEPSAMAFAEVSCADCHWTGKEVNRVNVAACVGCHEAAYEDTLRAWQVVGDTLLAHSGRMAEVYRAGTVEGKRLGEFAEALRKDGSRTVHNPDLFRKGLKRLRELP